ncbi:THO complex subunit 2 [Cryptococcus neoformans C23]|uniref:THO complex subunit 2 n=2 Tax=Cryptococcus neoformans TaxID=5207 RepID=A0A854QPD1_CRYNE|nr:THO complex subunit 2 [Cryptococcus neoformans var. grubii H99]AUB22988.1 THO complex subunit 2 [Cryptococcus neoformans var. grubii]OWZ34837.1 THO complex subunit 2 [Cryptococcus neoformans var. grubii AD2-60a]OWZ46936.1 THO complex subunit 2 [Cryptococcus neoformans var. grubii C23]OXG26563.1 THO complex subunit 2 [Cryptococcus neoformans var. grubii Tu259-1]OXG38941.1 THO complex subunit 2 [Cryptococcus neoformans var. grubii Bt15]OXG44761.1 THO complex subunit 2 [Cryptococcus neoforman|eukprot:XP_012047565.1 THO complex subunit 2 [Cryptococcus neoformans var. grubii H99]
MPPRRSTAKSKVQSATTSSLSPAEVITPSLNEQLSEFISQWETTGTESLHGLIISLLNTIASAPTTLGVVPLLHVLVTLLKSNVDERELTGVFEGVLDELEDERRDIFGEALVDAVEVLEEEQEDMGENKIKEEKEAKEAEDKSPKGVSILKLLLESNTLPSYIPNLLLNPERLIPLNLHPMPRNPRALQSALVKKNTTLFFKQRKFNLLRECSEGFSGLIVLLTSEDSLPSHPEEEDDEERRDRAERVWGKIMRLVGYFNLSPPRVLDIILEVFSCHITHHWPFFLELLRCSPWGPNSSQDDGDGESSTEKGWKEEEVEGIENALKRDGDRVLCQVLGFKFGFFRKSEAGDTPIYLIYTAALLVKHGFVSLTDLLPCLSPDDNEMETVRKKWASSLSSRSGPANALTNTILDDDEPPSGVIGSITEQAQNIPTKPPPEQRIQLTQALLALGDKAASEYMLARWPWIAQKSTGVADLILDIVEDAIKPVYEEVVANREEDEKFDLQAAAPIVQESESTEKQAVLTLFAPTPPETRTKKFKFFYPHRGGVCESWSSVEEIHEKGLRWLGLIGGLGGRRARLMVMLSRIGAAHFERLRKNKLEQGLAVEHLQPTEEELKPWLDIIRISLLPSLSCSTASGTFDVELWSLLKLFPYTSRYSLYGEWRDSTCNANGKKPCLMAAHAAAMTTKEVQKALRRVTSTNTSATSGATPTERHSARALAKQSHHNPVFVWTTAVTQVKAYPNIGEAIVDAGRYMAQLSFDVATFVMLDTLSDDRALRLNEMGTGVALWLERLSKFVGDFNRRYSNMDLYPVLQYIINRLMRGHSGDLIILEKLMSSMSGIEPVPNDGVSEAQLHAYAGGREMIREAFSATRISVTAPPEPGASEQPARAPVEKVKNVKKSLPRLVNALREKGLAMPIWIALAQTRQAVVDKMVNAPIKAMNLVQDTCHNTFVQFGDFLVDYLTSDEHIALTPDLQQLVVDFGLEYGMAFQILRPRLNAEIERARVEEKAAVQARLEAAKKAMSEKERTGSPQKVESPAFPGSPTTPSLQITPGATPGPGEIEDVVMEEIEKGALSVPAPKTLSSKGKMWWPSALTATMQQTRKLLPREANEVMSAPFFVIFWHLTTPDIAFSPQSYDNAIKSINRHISTISSWRVNPRDKPKMAEQRDELARLKARVKVLQEEKETHGSLVNGPMKRRMRLESGKWFGKAIVEKNLQRPLAIQLHQYCFYPRAILSPCDAVFVAKFIRMAHDLGTAGFSTLFVYNNFFNDNLAACIFSCTDSEARNLGRCLALILADLDKWHQSENVYLKEALGISPNPIEGGEQKRLPGMLFRSKAGDDMREMSWQEFRNFYAKCHNVLTRALISCWSEAEFMHNKNAIIVALQVIKYFPLMETNGKAVEAAVKKLQAGEVGEIPNDLKMMCTSFLSGLKKRQGARPFVAPATFHGAAARAAITRAPSAPKVESPAPSGTISTPSRPQPTNGVNGTASPSPAGTPGPMTTDPRTLRQKVEESRARAAASAAAKEQEAGAAPQSPLVHPIPTRPGVPTRLASSANSVPVTPTGPSAITRTSTPNATSVNSRAQTPVSSMGPPLDISVDEARAAARARRLGGIHRPPPPPPSAAAQTTHTAVSTPSTNLDVERQEEKAGEEGKEPGTPPIPVAESTRGRSPPASVKTSPTTTVRTHRDGSVESRASERSKRREQDRDKTRRDRDHRDRDKEREREKERDRRDRSAAEDDKRRQEDNAPASTQSDAGRESRRSRRDGERERDREEKKNRERERDDRKERDRDRSHRGEDSDRKRKRDEESSSRKLEPDASSGSRKERERERRRYDERDRERERDFRDRDRDRERDRNERDRDGHRDRRERERDGRRRDREGRDIRENRERHRTPPAEDGSGLASAASKDSTDTASNASGHGPARTPHALPARPGNSEQAPRLPQNAAPVSQNPQEPLSLAARMGGIARPASPHVRANEPVHRSTRDDLRRDNGWNNAPRRDEATKEESRKEPADRKRALEAETGSEAREESPGASKRVKIDRNKARGRRQEGGVKMFQQAMGSAKDK